MNGFPTGPHPHFGLADFDPNTFSPNSVGHISTTVPFTALNIANELMMALLRGTVSVLYPEMVSVLFADNDFRVTADMLSSQPGRNLPPPPTSASNLPSFAKVMAARLSKFSDIWFPTVDTTIDTTLYLCATPPPPPHHMQ